MARQRKQLRARERKQFVKNGKHEEGLNCSDEYWMILNQWWSKSGDSTVEISIRAVVCTVLGSNWLNVAALIT